MKPTKVCVREECRAVYARPRSSGQEEWANRVYCSRACYEAVKRAERLAALPLCAWCKERRVGDAKRVYCGLSCSGKAQAATGKTPPPPPQEAKPRPPCAREGCGALVKLPHQRYCSQACVGLAKRNSPERAAVVAEERRQARARKGGAQKVKRGDARERDRVRSQARRDAAKVRPRYVPPPGYDRVLWRPPGSLDHPMPIGPAPRPAGWPGELVELGEAG